jgi:hypothetical protein
MLPSERNEAYLQALQDRNRLKRMSSRNRQEELIEEKEKGIIMLDISETSLYLFIYRIYYTLFWS